jgi:anti-anti-sigma regulatory factor
MALELYIEKKGRSTCVALVGEFEVAGVEQLKSRLERFDEDGQPVIDLRRIVVVDAAAIQSERDKMGERPGSRRDSRA